MAAVDKIRLLPGIAVPAAAANDGTRQRSPVENNKRTERFNLRVTGQVDITVAGTGLRNRGSILAAITDLGFEDGGADKVVADARMQRAYAEFMSRSVLPAARLGGAGVQAATLLNEIVPVFLSSPGSVDPNETKYVEVNKQSALNVFITPQRLIGRLVAGAPTGTVTNLAVTLEQVYDDLTEAPYTTIYQRQIVQNVNAANAALRVDLRGSRYIRGLIIQQDTDIGEVGDIINSLVLRGDANSMIGDAAVPLRDLIDAGQIEYGGATAFVQTNGAYTFVDFQRYGRISSWWNPYQDTNMRLELNVQPSVTGGAAASFVRVGVIEYERTAVTAPTIPFTI